MRARYTVEVEMKEGFSPMTTRRIETAVWDSAPIPGAIRNVTVVRSDVKDKVFGCDLFGLGQKLVDTWLIEDYYNTHRKAENAVRKARESVPEGVYAVFKYNPKTSVWEKC